MSPVINLDKTFNIPPYFTGAASVFYLINTDDQPIDMDILVKDWIMDRYHKRIHVVLAIMLKIID